MKKLSLFAFLILNIAAFSQSEFQYKAKFVGANDATTAAPIIKAMKMVFKTDAVFNEASSQVEFKSKMSISQTVFNNMMSGEGFAVESFERHEIKAEEPAVVKTEPVPTPTTTGKKDAPVKTESASVQPPVKKPK